MPDFFTKAFDVRADRLIRTCTALKGAQQEDGRLQMGKTGEIKKPAAEKPAEEKKGGAPAHGASHAAPSAPRGSVNTKLGCLCLTCKEKDSRFNFCDEHFRQFKFGLITKSGEKVLDFEKKFEHYQKWLKAQQLARVG